MASIAERRCCGADASPRASPRGGGGGKCPIPGVRRNERGRVIVEVAPSTLLAGMVAAAVAGALLACAVRGRPP